MQEGQPHPYLPGCTVVAVQSDQTMGRYRVTVRYDTLIFKGIVEWEPAQFYGEVARYGEYRNDDRQVAGLIKDVMGEAYGQYGELVGPAGALWPCCVIRPMFEQWLYDRLADGGSAASPSP